MAKTLTSSQLTFVDITDTKKLSIYLASNLQNVQMRTQTGTETYVYNPDWTSTNLKITLQAFLDQKKLSDQDPDAINSGRLSISWYSKDGNGAEQQIYDENDNPFSGITLTVATNSLGSTISKMITYICRVSYIDPETGVSSSVENQFTYTLIDTARDAKTCSITGEQVFKYDISGNVSPTSITLNALVQNVGTNVSYDWKYWNPNSMSWEAYPQYTTGSELTVYPEDQVFFGDLAKIKMSPGSNLYDIITITKIYDGKTGDPACTVLLTNESYIFPGETDYAIEHTMYTEAIAYQGSVQKDVVVYTVDDYVPNGTGVSPTKTTGLYFSVNGSKIMFKAFNNLTDNAGTIPIVVEVGGVRYKKVFSWSVAYKGSGACSISIEPSSQIFKSIDGVEYTPNSITLTPHVQNLSLADVRWQYSTPQFTGWANISNTTESSTQFYYDNDTKVLTLPNANVMFSSSVTSIVFKCFVGNYSDIITIAKLTDGKSGAAAYTVILSNEMQGISTDQSFMPFEDKSFDCSVVVYKGTDELTATNDSPSDGQFRIILPENPNGIALSKESANVVRLTVSKSTQISSFGDIYLGIQVESEDYELPKTISYVAVREGVSPVVFQIFAPNGTVFSNQSGTLPLKTVAYDGIAEINKNDATYQWAAYDPDNPEDLNKDGYKDIYGATNDYYDVSGSDVVNIQTYRCIMTYNGNDYIATITIEDKSDPYISEMLTVGGTTFKNGQGGTAVYVIVRSNGKEVDPFPNGRLPSVSTPTPTTAGEYWWKVYDGGTDSGGVTLMKSNTSLQWEQVDPESNNTQDLKYTWTLMNKDGTYNPDFVKYGKVIYLTCGDIYGSGTLQCDVTTE